MSWLSRLAGLLLLLPYSVLGHNNLTTDEQNTVEIYQAAKSSVVFVANKAIKEDPYNERRYEHHAGAGSGFVWNKDGHIITNYHVVAGASEITVRLQDGQERVAKLIGVAPERDLAVLQIKLDYLDLNPLKLGDSSQLAVGHKVLAIGNPFGLDATLTTGVVSALKRTIQSPAKRTIKNVIQTDAAINPGNSGGPLLNSSGELIGINTAIFSPSGASAGISFSIPVNTLKTTIPQLIKYGRIQRPVLGVALAPKQIAQSQRIDGLLISDVTPGLSADLAGLKGFSNDDQGKLVLGDALVSINGQKIFSSDELLSLLESLQYGDIIELRIIRNGVEQSVSVELIAPTT